MRTVGVLFLVIASLFKNASAAVDVSSDAGPKVCSGTTVTFTCRASESAARWRYNGETVFVELSTAGNLPLGPFVVTVIGNESNSTFVTITATAPITSELSGTSITCENFAITEIDIATLPNITGPLDFPRTLNVSDITLVSEDLWEFNLTWEVPSNDSCDLKYIFTPLQPLSVCTTIATCTTECRGFRVGPGPRSYTVTAQNCGGTQNGTESDPLLVCFQRPGAPESVLATPTYDLNSNGALSSLVLSWDEVIPKLIAAGVDESISYYEISGVGTGSIQVAPNGNCSNGRCSYEVDVPEDGSTEYNASVAAMNVLGVGDATTVGPVFASNDYANVTTKIEEGNCTLTVECLIEGVDKFWITVNQSGTTVLTRRLMDCNTPALAMIEELPMLPGDFNYEIEVMFGEDVMVILLGRFEGNCTEVVIIIPPDEDSSGGSSAAAIAGGAAGGVVAVGCGGGVIFNGVVAVCKRTSITLHPCAIILLCLLSWFYGFYLLCRPCCYSTSQKKPSQERSVEAAVDDEVKASEEVIDMSDAYETVSSTQPAVRTKVMGVESTQPQQGAAKSEEEPKVAKKKGLFKNRSGKKADKKKSDEVELQPQEPLEPAETGAETGALYQDPGEIKREEYPGTHDFYAQPDIKRKTHKPEDHLPTYGDPRDIKHVEAPETGELYAVTKQPSKKRAAPPPPEGATGYTSVDIEKKHRAKELNYSELQMPPGGPAPPSQHVEYSNVVQL